MSRSASLREKVALLRRQEKSYSKICNITGVPKSTLSDWLSSEAWSTKIKSKLTKKQIKTYKLNIIKANEVRIREKKLRHKRFIAEARNQYISLKNDRLFIYSLGIYWGEGDKKSGSSVEVINTDPNLLLVISKFYRRCLHIDESKLRVRLFIYKDINKKFAMNFWSKLLQIPINQFIKVQVLESRAKLTKQKSKYGICSIYFSNTEVHVKMMEWLRLLSLDLQV